ncbi:hypothetical protein V7O61_04540 [Methanolobus sp. WCC1]|uniref:hypothetical protein n=1 Tax=unclassified Methanolobus TaxID=2629569 RepID=UPI003246FCD6
MSKIIPESPVKPVDAKSWNMIDRIHDRTNDADENLCKLVFHFCHDYTVYS